MLASKYSDSLVGFRENMEGVSVGDNLGRSVYTLSIMLAQFEESMYVEPPEVNHLLWLFQQTAVAMIEMIMKDPVEGMSNALTYFKQQRDELLK